MRYFTCRERYGLFVPEDRVRLVSSRPTINPVNVGGLSRPAGSIDVPPFKMSEATSRIVQLSSEFGESVDRKIVEGMDSNLPKTPQKNIIDFSSALMETAIKANLNTPGSNALSRELLKRQDEINMLRRTVEPLLQSAQHITKQPGTTEHLVSIVQRLGSAMIEYDKVVSRYERHLQKIIGHLEKKRLANQQAKNEADQSFAHQLQLKEKEITDLNNRLVGAETQTRLLRKEYEQVRNIELLVSYLLIWFARHRGTLPCTLGSRRIYRGRMRS